MLRIPKHISSVLSLVLAGLFGGAVTAFAFILPRVVDNTLKVLPNVNVGYELTSERYALLLGSVYLLLTLALTADGLLFALLVRIRRGAVFTAKTVALIRGVSWCCLLFAGVTFAMGWLFSPILLGGYLFAGVAMIATLAGLCLRVIKNVVEEAAAIKSENDLTV